MSDISKITELREERYKLVSEMRGLYEKADAENRALTGDESEQYEKLDTRIVGIEKDVERRERAASLQPNPALAAAAATTEKGVSVEKTQPATLNEYRAEKLGPRPQDVVEYRNAFFRFVTVRDTAELTVDEVRVLSKASAGAGLNLVPTSFEKTLLGLLRDTGVMRQLANVISTSSGEALQYPSVTTHGVATWTAENAAYTASDEVFGQATLNAYKAATLIIVSEELLADAAFDLEAYISNEFALRIGVLENTAYVVGDGSGKPTGLVPGLSVGKTAASATAITTDELIDLYHSVLPPYRANAVWMFKDSTIALIRKLKDSTNQYLWQPGMQVGQADVLFGKPVYTDPDIPAATTGLRSVVFGDIRQAYTIRDASGISFQRLNELYAANGQVGFRAYHRTDGKVVNTTAAKVLIQA